MTDLMTAREHRFNEDGPAIGFICAWIFFVYGYGCGRVKSLMSALYFRGKRNVRMVEPCSSTRGKYLIWDSLCPVNERNVPQPSVQSSNLKVSLAVAHERIPTHVKYCYFLVLRTTF